MSVKYKKMEKDRESTQKASRTEVGAAAKAAAAAAAEEREITPSINLLEEMEEKRREEKKKETIKKHIEKAKGNELYTASRDIREKANESRKKKIIQENIKSLLIAILKKIKQQIEEQQEKIKQEKIKQIKPLLIAILEKIKQENILGNIKKIRLGEGVNNYIKKLYLHVSIFNDNMTNNLLEKAKNPGEKDQNDNVTKLYNDLVKLFEKGAKKYDIDSILEEVLNIPNNKTK